MLDIIRELAKSYERVSIINRLPSFAVMFIVTLAFMCGTAGEFHTSGAMLTEMKPAVFESGASAELSKDVLAAKSESKFTQILSEDEISDVEEPDKGLTDAELIKAAKLSTMDEKARARLALEEENEAQASEDAKKEKESSKKKKSPDGFVYSQNIPLSYQLQEYTYEKCVERGLEYELILAIIWRESRFNVDAVNINTNGTRDHGLMQINDVNKKWLRSKYGIDNLMDPYQNINAGTAMLSELTEKYGVHNAMMAYQYGEGGMARRLRQGATTSAEVESAYRQRDHYRQVI